MGIKLEWDNKEKTIIRYDVTDPWTWEEFREALDSDDAMFDSVDHIVHLLLNMMDIRSAPPNMLAKLPQIVGNINPRLGLLVIAGDYVWIKTIGDIFYRVYGHSVDGLAGIKSAHTLEEARQIIAEYSA